MMANNSDLTWTNYSAIKNNITFTLNEDLSITMNGKCNSNGVEFTIVSRTLNTFTLPIGDYVLSGATYINDNIGIGVNRTVSGSGVRYGFCTGQPVQFNVTDSTASTGVWISILNSYNVEFDNVTFYPMICTLDDWNISHNYQPSRKMFATEQEIIDVFNRN